MKLPRHKCGLYITHNQNRDYYETAEEYIESRESLEDGPTVVFGSAENRQRCIDTNELWEVCWFPDTPVGSYQVMGPTLKIVMELIEKDFQLDEYE